jgi:hypothetical protein
MEIFIKKHIEPVIRERINNPIRLYNPESFDHTKNHRIKCIEATEEYTRIDFIIRSSMIYINGGWIQMDRNAYIEDVQTGTRYGLIKAEGIPIAPEKYYFSRQGEFHTYTLIYPGLPKSTRKIHIIERIAPGNYFNFFNVDYANWLTIAHPADLPINNN